jgi:hypothetical protein
MDMGEKPQIHSHKICRYVYTKDAKIVHIDFAILVVCNATTKVSG